MITSGITTPLGITNLLSAQGTQIRIESTSFVIDNKWIDYKGRIFNLNDYINQALTTRSTFFLNRSYAIYLVIGIDFSGTLLVEEGAQVSFRIKSSVPPPTLQNIIPLVGLVVVQDGSEDLNFGYNTVTDDDLIRYSGFGNILEKNLSGITGIQESVRGEIGTQGVTGILGPVGPVGPTGVLGIQGPVGRTFVGTTGAIGLTGLNYNVNYDTGLEIYLKFNDPGDDQTDSSGNFRDVGWTGLGNSYHTEIPAIMCEGQSTVYVDQPSSFIRSDTEPYSILTGPGVISEVTYINSLPSFGNKIIIAEFDGVEHSFIYYIDSNGCLNFQDDYYRWVSNTSAIRTKEWTLLEFHKLSSTVAAMYRTTAVTPQTELITTRITL